MENDSEGNQIIEDGFDMSTDWYNKGIQREILIGRKGILYMGLQ